MVTAIGSNTGISVMTAQRTLHSASAASHTGIFG